MRAAGAAAYDGVEVMGSEGYLLNQFLCPRTNRRDDQWGGPLENRMRLALEIVRGIRRIVGQRFILCYRLSLLDLVEGGNTWDEVRRIALALEEAGITLLNTGIGWHESRVPTIVTSVPRAAAEVSARLRYELKVPVIASNRINTPEVAESLLAAGKADLVSMARPLLADPQFVAKAGAGRAEEINTCIACNQACLDHAFANRRATCLVNPRAAFETELRYRKARTQKRIAVIGAGPPPPAWPPSAGIGSACSRRAGNRRTVQPGQADSRQGRVPRNPALLPRAPGTPRRRPAPRPPGAPGRAGRSVRRRGGGHRHPATPARIDGIGGPTVLSYVDVLRGAPVGARVAIVGAGGIGFDVAAFLVAAPSDGQPRALGEWLAEWGVDLDNSQPGGLREPAPTQPARQVWLLQRKPGAPGAQLGKTSGWVHRAHLRHNAVRMLGGVEYLKIDERGLLIRVDGENAGWRWTTW